MINLNTYTLIGGRRKAIVHLDPRLEAQMSPQQRRQLESIITSKVAKPNCRSHTEQLHEPVVIDEAVVIQSLRLKGINPYVVEGRTIPRHTGSGNVNFPVYIDKAGYSFTKEDPTGQPEGGMLAENAKTEFLGASILGRTITDLPLGYGTYPDLTYEGHQLGFVIFGMEERSDLRFEEDVISDWVEFALSQGGTSYTDHEISHLACSFGLATARLHRHFAHRYLHLRNVGVIRSPLEVRIRDLETLVPLAELTAPQGIGYFLLDISRVSYEFRHRPDFFLDFIRGYCSQTPPSPITHTLQNAAPSTLRTLFTAWDRASLGFSVNFANYTEEPYWPSSVQIV